MKTVALVWELGSGLGHIATFLPIVEALKSAGYRPFLILRDISQVHVVYPNIDVDYVQAPSYSLKQGVQKNQINFTDSLFYFGYDNHNTLATITQAWANLFKLIQPDLLILDYAPTALLASRVLDKVPSIIFGNCFATPPRQSPLPPYVFWQDSNDDMPTMIRQERQCLETINEVLDRFNLAPIQCVHEIYTADHYFITTDKQLDIYGPRDYVEYLGAISTNEIGNKNIVWPLPDKTKIFVYIKSNYQHIEALLTHLAQSDAQYIIYSVSLSAEKKKAYYADNIIFGETPYNIDEMCKQSQGAIIHGGNLMDQFLAAGKPLLLLPMQMENLMMAKTAVKYGAAISFAPGADTQLLPSMLKQLIHNPVLNYNALTLSQRMLKLKQCDQIAKIIDRIKQLLPN